MMAIDHERVGVAIPNRDRFGALQMWVVRIKAVMDVDDDARILARRP